ncbi:SGNH/GDSL hydrolase family protein [Larkinella sp. VNQ87]|uniref:SGNH/GDSL hydrolase family protein n=1 Tax=Larkinella sp. VNQ87 TaxID=3400921 RepID=UPI003C0B0EA9
MNCIPASFLRLGILLLVFTFWGCSGTGVEPDRSTSDIIVGWGDSLTEGVGGTPYLVELERLSGYKTINQGIAGQTSKQIAERMLADKEKHSYNTIIWVGRNNYLEPDQIKADIASMVKVLGHSRYLVLSIINGHNGPAEQVFGLNHKAITQLNNDLYQTYGDHYVNVHAYLLSKYDPTSMADIIDHTDDVVPASLRADELHLNSKGYALVAERINQSINILTNKK